MSTTTGLGRFPAELVHAAAVLYFEEAATQSDIASRLGVSQATVSRLLSEARRSGMVQIKVLPLSAGHDALADQVAQALGLRRAYVFPDTAPEVLSAGMAPALSAALDDAHLSRGDVLLVSSGKVCYSAARCDLPTLPGVLVAPTVGGLLEPAPWYQTNEIIREFALRLKGQPNFLYAPAVPGAQLHQSLVQDPATGQVVQMWDQAECAVLGIGAAPTSGRHLPHYALDHLDDLSTAVGDVCSRFYDAAGNEVAFPGSEYMLSTTLERLKSIPTSIAVAVGAEKVESLRAAARARFFNTLVTDTSTAALLLT